MKLKVPIYGQRDYPNLYLGNTNSSVAQYGCTSVVTASALGFKPEDFVKKMNEAKGYSGDLLIWNVAAKLRNTSVTLKDWGNSKADINWIKQQVLDGKPVLIETRFPGYQDRDDVSHQHWLVVVSDDLICNDPWFEDEIFFEGRYGDPERWIYSAFVFDYKLNETQSETMQIEKKIFEELISKLDRQEKTIDGLQRQLTDLEDKKNREIDNLTNENIDFVTACEGSLKSKDEEIAKLKKQLPSSPTTVGYKYNDADILLDKPFKIPVRLIKLD